MFDVVGSIAQAGGVEDVDRDAGDVKGFAHDVAGGARLGGNDGTLFANEGVEQAGFASVRFASDDKVDAIVHQAALGALCKQAGEAFAPVVQTRFEVAFAEVVVFFFGEVQRSFDVGAQGEQFSGKRVHFLGEGAL